MLKELNNIFFSYIWGNKRDKVSRKQMIKDYRDGGCRMIDIRTYKISKIRQYIEVILSETNDG